MWSNVRAVIELPECERSSMPGRSKLIWNDPTSYKVRVGHRGRANVVEWIVSKDGRQVQALADDGKYYPLYDLIPPPSKTHQPRWIVPAEGIFKGRGYVSEPRAKWMPSPGGKTEKMLLNGEVGTPQQQSRYGRFKERLDRLKKEHYGD